MRSKDWKIFALHILLICLISMVSLDVISGKPCLYAQNPIGLTFMQPLTLDFTGGSFDNDRNMSNRFYSPNLINIGSVLISDSNPLPPATGMDYLNFNFVGSYYMGSTYLSDSNPLPAINPAQMTNRLGYGFGGAIYAGNTYLSDSNPLPAINPAQMTNRFNYGYAEFGYMGSLFLSDSNPLPPALMMGR